MADEQEPTAPARDISWAERVAGILDAVEFDPALDDTVVDRIANTMVHTRVFHAPAGRQAAAIDRALGEPVRLTGLVPSSRDEEEFRDFLHRLRRRLDELTPWPEWRYEQVSSQAWSWSAARPIARLALRPARLATGLSVAFEQVRRGGTTLELAVLRIADGPLIALARDRASTGPETTVYAPATEPTQPTLAAFLAATGVRADAVTWQAEEPTAATIAGWEALADRLARVLDDLPDGAALQLRPRDEPVTGWSVQLWRQSDRSHAEVVDETGAAAGPLDRPGWQPAGRTGRWSLTRPWPADEPGRTGLAGDLVTTLREAFQPESPDALVHRYWATDGAVSALAALELNPLQVTYFARVRAGGDPENPSELLRRVRAGYRVVDDALGADGIWHPTDAVNLAELGDLDGRAIPLEPRQAALLLGAWQPAAPPQPVAEPRWSTVVRDDADRPVPAGAPVLDAFERTAVACYLCRAPVAVATMGLAEDPYQADRPEVVPLHVHTDGVWVWSETEAYFAERYGIPPDPALLAHIRRHDYRAPDELPTDVLMRAADATA